MEHTNNEQQARDIRKTTLEFESWADKIMDKEVGLLEDIIIPDEFFEGFYLINKTESESTFHSKRAIKYMFGVDKQKNDKLIQVILCECDSVSNAHESIIDYFMGSMANKIPRGEEKNIQVGDITFIGYGDKVSTIIFARNNIMVAMQSVGDTDMDIQTFAKTFDDWLQKK